MLRLTDFVNGILASPTKPEGKGSRSPKKSSSPRKSQAKPTAKETIVGQPGKYKNSDVEVVVALFERMIAKGDHEDVAAIAEQFGLDKRLLRMVSLRDSFHSHLLKRNL
jgi:hypothetical protein